VKVVDDSEQARPRRHRLRAWLIAGVVLLLVLVAGVAWLFLGGEAPRPVTVEEAKKRTDGSTVSTAPANEFGPPAAGVYLYRGEGTEDTSFPPLTEEQGPTMPGTITGDGDGCWRFRIDYSSHHWQDWRHCADPTGIVSTGGRTFAQRAFGTLDVDNVSTFTCSEPEVWLWDGMQVGESREATCTGTATAIAGTTTSTGPTTYIGDDDIEVGGETVRARHLRHERVLTGAQEGSEQADWWVDPVTLLPIRNEHRVTVDTTFGALTITYTEVTSYTLTSLDPE
jgi:hypothetical protein